MLLANCSNTQSITLPDTAYQCQAWPQAPTGVYGDVSLGKYIVQANYSYNDCKGKLQALKP